MRIVCRRSAFFSLTLTLPLTSSLSSRLDESRSFPLFLFHFHFHFFFSSFLRLLHPSCQFTKARAGWHWSRTPVAKGQSVETRPRGVHNPSPMGCSPPREGVVFFFLTDSLSLSLLDLDLDLDLDLASTPCFPFGRQVSPLHVVTTVYRDGEDVCRLLGCFAFCLLFLSVGSSKIAASLHSSMDRAWLARRKKAGLHGRNVRYILSWFVRRHSQSVQFGKRKVGTPLRRVQVVYFGKTRQTGAPPKPRRHGSPVCC